MTKDMSSHRRNAIHTRPSKARGVVDNFGVSDDSVEVADRPQLHMPRQKQPNRLRRVRGDISTHVATIISTPAMKQLTT